MINFELKETIKIGDDLCRCYRSKNKHSFIKAFLKKGNIDYSKVKGYIFLFYFPQQDKVYIFGKNGIYPTEILTGLYFPYRNEFLKDDFIEFDNFARYLFVSDTDTLDTLIKGFIVKHGLTLEYQGKDIQKLINEHYRRFLR